MDRQISTEIDRQKDSQSTYRRSKNLVTVQSTRLDVSAGL